jgi:carbonic anhydrase
MDEDLALHNKVAQRNILQQIVHIKSYPAVQRKIEEGLLQVHGWYFDIGKGDVYGYEQEFNKFILIDQVEAQRICDRIDCVHH